MDGDADGTVPARATHVLVLEGRAWVHTEDGGMAAIAEVEEDGEQVFVRVQSWDETSSPQHPFLEEIAGGTVPRLLTEGRRVRVTVEILEEGPDTYGGTDDGTGGDGTDDSGSRDALR